jgi:hypothetical protein
MKFSIMRLMAAGSLAAGVAACGSDSTAPQSSLVGSYTAVQWVTTGGSGQTNQLVAGSTLQIALSSNGTTSGHMHIAASGGSPVSDFDMAGTWERSGNSVDFSQNADSFVRDMTFAMQPVANNAWDLVGDHTFSGTRIQITLRRAP